MLFNEFINTNFYFPSLILNFQKFNMQFMYTNYDFTAIHSTQFHFVSVNLLFQLKNKTCSTKKKKKSEICRWKQQYSIFN